MMKIKMKFLYLNLLTSLALCAFAHANDCAQRVAEYGTDTSSGELESECVEWIKSQSLLNSTRSAVGSSYKSFATDGVILYEDSKGVISVTAGPNTQLGQVHAVAFSLGARRVYALDSVQGKITSYDLEIAGNVAPKGALISREIIGAKDIAVSTDGSKVFVLHSDQARVTVFDGTRNILGRQEVAQMKIVGHIEFEDLSRAHRLALSEDDKSLLIAVDGDQVVRYRFSE